MAERKSNLEENVSGPSWKPFVHREVTVIYKDDMYTGTFNVPDVDNGWVDLLPHLEFLGNGKGVYLETEAPIRIPLSVFENNLAIVRPRHDGYMKSKEETINEELNSNRKKISFHDGSKG